MRVRLCMLLAIASFSASYAPSATAQDAPQTADGAFDKKQRRLNIAGWTLVGAGVAFPVIMAPIAAKSDTNCDPLECPVFGVAVTSYILGPVMAITGGALLLKRRGLRKEHDRNTKVAIAPTLTGLTISGRF